MSDFKLNEEQNKKFLEYYSSGDIFALEYLEALIKENVKHNYSYEDLHDIIKTILQLNRMISFSEDFTGFHSELYSLIEPLYSEAKQKFFELIGVKFEED